MSLKSTKFEYGRITQVFHWLSAVAIILMFPMGYIMQSIGNGPTKLFLYRMHVVLGIGILLLTLLRIGWRWLEPTPNLPSGLSPIHQFVFKATHFLLYLILLVLSLSGLGLMALGGVGDILFNPIASDAIPTDLSHLPPRVAHGLAAKLYIALLVAHIGGVMLHQLTKSDVLVRMGWGRKLEARH